MPLILLTIKIWDTNLGVLKKTLNGHTDTIRDFVLLDKNILASAAEDYTIKIWNISEGRVKQNLTGHIKRVLALVMLKNGDLVSASSDKTIKVWDLSDGAVKRHKDKLPHSPPCLRNDCG